MSLTSSLVAPGRNTSPGIDAPSLAIKVFAAYVFVVPLGSTVRSPLPLPLIPDTLSSALAAAVIVTMLVELVPRPNRRAALGSSARLWLALLGFAALSHAWSINRPDTYEGVISLGVLVAMTIVVVKRQFSCRDVKLLETALIGSAVVTGSIAVFQWWNGTLAPSGTDIARFALVGEDPNHTAAALILPAGAALVVALDSGERSSRRIAAAGAFTVAGAAVLLAASRGGLISLSALALMILIRRVGVKRAALFALPVLLLLTAVRLPVDQRTTGDTGRGQVWTIGVVSCSDVCWSGSGFNTFRYVHERTAIARPELARLELQFESHNLWLGTLVELGIVGFGLVALIMLFAFRAGLQSVYRLGDAAASAVIALLIANFFINGFEFKYFWLVLLVAAVIAPRPESPREFERLAQVA